MNDPVVNPSSSPKSFSLVPAPMPGSDSDSDSVKSARNVGSQTVAGSNKVVPNALTKESANDDVEQGTTYDNDSLPKEDPVVEQDNLPTNAAVSSAGNYKRWHFGALALIATVLYTTIGLVAKQGGSESSSGNQSVGEGGSSILNPPNGTSLNVPTAAPNVVSELESGKPLENPEQCNDGGIFNLQLVEYILNDSTFPETLANVASSNSKEVPGAKELAGQDASENLAGLAQNFWHQAKLNCAEPITHSFNRVDLKTLGVKNADETIKLVSSVTEGAIISGCPEGINRVKYFVLHQAILNHTISNQNK